MLCVVGVLALASATASAQGRPVEPQATMSAHDRAIALFEQSVAAYRSGRFADASTLLREAYALEPAPVLLYNLAPALAAEGQVVDARDAYRRFLAQEPEADQRASCERRIEVLTAQIEASTTVAPPPPAEEPAPAAVAPEALRTEGPPGPDVLAPMIVVGLGAAVAITGGVLVGVGADRHGAAEVEPVSLRAAEIESEALGLRDVGVALLAVGGVAVLAGAIWATVASLPTANGEVEARIGPTGASIRGRF